jgi:hypothetical protein
LNTFYSARLASDSSGLVSRLISFYCQMTEPISQDLSMDLITEIAASDVEIGKSVSTSASASGDVETIAAPLKDRTLDDTERAAVRQGALSLHSGRSRS